LRLFYEKALSRSALSITEPLIICLKELKKALEMYSEADITGALFSYDSLKENSQRVLLKSLKYLREYQEILIERPYLKQ